MATSRVTRERAIETAIEFVGKLFEAGYSHAAAALLAEVIGAAAGAFTGRALANRLFDASELAAARWAPAAARFLKGSPKVGHFGEIVRAVTAAAAIPEKSFRYLYWPEIITRKITYQQLENAGYSLLSQGQAPGLALIGSSLRRSRGIRPLQAISSAIEHLPSRQYVSVEPFAAQTYAHSAVDLWESGWREPAVRIGAIVPALRSSRPSPSSLTQMWESFYDQPGIQKRVGAAEKNEAMRLGETLLQKGYPAEATRLQLDALRLRPADYQALWSGIEPTLKETINEPVVRIVGRLQERYGYATEEDQSRADEWLEVMREEDASVGDTGAGNGDSDGGGGDGSNGNGEGKKFYFRLQGENAYRNQVERNTDFQLVFNYGVPEADALATAAGSELEAVRKTPDGELEIYISVDSEKLELRKGAHAFAVAQFKDEEILEPVRFLLHAKSGQPGTTWIEVHFSVSAVLLYSFKIQLELVATIDKSASNWRPIPLDLDELRIQDRMERDVQLRIDEVPGGMLVTFVQRGQPIGPPIPTPNFVPNLDKELQSIRERLRLVAEEPLWNNLGRDLKPPLNSEALRDQMKAVLAAGSALHARIKKTPLKEVMEKIDLLPDGSKISVHTKTAFIPWEIMFTMEYDQGWSADVVEEQQNFRPEMLWGHRFQIETQLSPDADVPADVSGPQPIKIPRSRQPAPLKVVLAIGKTIEEGDAATKGTKEAVEWQRNYVAERLKANGQLAMEKKEIEPIFVAAKYSATFVYLLCHGQSKSSGGSADDVLEFAKDYLVTPNTLITKNVYNQSPIIFLNSCSSGAVAPLSLTGFLTGFLEKKACGVIGALFPLPIRFAAAFGEKLMDGYLAARPIGEVLFEARRSLLDQNIPLGLFYTLQCPLDILAPTANKEM